MKGEGEKIIYVGKAVNLRSRVKSYFLKEAESRYQVRFLMKRVVDIDYLVTSNEKEALLLENSLIKKHKPRYNIHLKDDKSYVSLRISMGHPFPALTVTRKIKKDGSLYFGPYSSATACRETVELIYKHFKLRTCSDNEISNRSRPCLEYQINRCTAPCVGFISQADYARQITAVRLFLEGKADELLDVVKTNMQKAIDAEKFEDAAQCRDLLQHLETTLEKQGVVKHGGGHQDLLYLYHEEEKGMLAILSVRDGSLVDSRTHALPVVGEESQVMAVIMGQIYLQDGIIPEEILVNHLPEDLEVLQQVLSEKRGGRVGIRLPQKGEKKHLLDLAESNARSQFDRQVKKEFETGEILEKVQKALLLPGLPLRVECYDISNISGKNPTASRVVFIDGKADKSHYRQYKIKSPDEPNDYLMMREVLLRRFAPSVGAAPRGRPSPAGQPWEGQPQGVAPTEDLPNLILVDGGKGQLGVALEVLKELGLENIPVVGIAKGSEKGARSKSSFKGKKEEEFYLPGRKNALKLKSGSPELHFLQRVRDEAHRFAVKYHRYLREKL